MTHSYQFHAEAQGEAVVDSCDAATEVGAIQAYVNGLIAAARHALSRAEAATVIRSLRNQKILAMRAARDRRRAARANQRRRVHSRATDAASKRQLG